MSMLSKIKGFFLGPKDYVVVIDDDDAYVIPLSRVIATDIVATKPSRLPRARKFAKALNKELDAKYADHS